MTTTIMCIKSVILQGDRTKNVGVVDREYIVHKGIQTLGGNEQELTKVFCPSSLHLFEMVFYLCLANLQNDICYFLC